ncbi:MAG: hypothetical protein AB1347_06120 [Acidobacteriota bacterium]
MTRRERTRSIIKFLFWAAASAGAFWYAVHFYTSGRMVHWYYYQAKADGYAVNARAFMDATPERPAALTVGEFSSLDGLQARAVKKGEVLPEHATGVISLETLAEGRRASLEGGTLTVKVPWELKQAKGFKYKDTFTHKNIKTNPLSGLWNIVMVGLIGVCLGYLAEGFTDMLGLKFKKIDHSVGH